VDLYKIRTFIFLITSFRIGGTPEDELNYYDIKEIEHKKLKERKVEHSIKIRDV